jgi:hypothetical protein
MLLSAMTVETRFLSCQDRLRGTVAARPAADGADQWRRMNAFRLVFVALSFVSPSDCRCSSLLVHVDLRR